MERLKQTEEKLKQTELNKQKALKDIVKLEKSIIEESNHNHFIFCRSKSNPGFNETNAAVKINMWIKHSKDLNRFLLMNYQAIKVSLKL